MQHLSGFDGMWYAYDHSKTAKAIMGSLMIFEPSEANDAGDVTKVIARLQDRLKVIPPLRRRVDSAPVGINNQYWRECVVDVADHVSEVTLAAPGGDRELAEAAAKIMETGLDRSRPMWDYTVFHGLSGGRQAHLMRIHHAACDGGTMQRVLGLLSDYSDEFSADEKDYPGPLMSDAQAKAEMVRRGITRTALMPSQLLEVQKHTLKWLGRRVKEDGAMAAPALVARMLPGALGRPLAKAVNAKLGENARKVQPIQPRVIVPESKFNAKITSERSYAWVTLPMSDLLRIGKYYGVTFHSVVTAISASAARQFLIANGEPVDKPLILMSPYSLRRGGEENYWANYAANFLAEFPVHLSDPVERLKVCGKNVAEARANFDTMPTDMMIDMSRMIPQLMWDAMYQVVDYTPEEVLKRSSMGGNFTISNIRGPSKRFHMYGTDMSEFLPVSFLGQGLAHNVTCSSYAGELQIGFVGCPKVFPHSELWDWPGYYRNAVAELLELMEGEPAKAPSAPSAVALKVSAPARTRKAAAPRKTATKAAPARRKAATSKAAPAKAAPTTSTAKAAPATPAAPAEPATPAAPAEPATPAAPAEPAETLTEAAQAPASTPPPAPEASAQATLTPQGDEG
ncbi:MAG: wax ester/triacylglycerol synthase domain-containing protein [Dermatophilaceae bacterium]